MPRVAILPPGWQDTITAATNAGQILNSQTLGISWRLYRHLVCLMAGTTKQIEIAKQQGSILETRKTLQLARVRTTFTFALQGIKTADTNLNLEQQNNYWLEENLL